MKNELILPDTVHVTGHKVETGGFSPHWRESVIDIARKIAAAQQKSEKSRYIVAIGGASGSSKSTTVAVLKELLPSLVSASVVSVGLDGYHYPRALLRDRLDPNGDPLILHKGRFDTYDTPALQRDLAHFAAGHEVLFPVYSRIVHDPLPQQTTCATGNAILLLEGLWLLYAAEPWQSINEHYYDLTLFFHGPTSFLAANTIGRHTRGGRSQTESQQYYRENDAIHAKLVTENIVPPDLAVYWK